MPIVAPTAPQQLPYDQMSWDQNGLVVYAQDLRNTLWNTISEFDWAFADLYNYQNGVIGSSGLQISGVSGMTFQLSTGRARAVNGLKVVQLVSSGINGQPSSFQFGIANGNPSNPRIDVVALKYDWFTYVDGTDQENHTVDNTSIVVIQGTPAATPVAPALPDNTYVAVGTIRVPAGATNFATCVIDNTQRTILGAIPPFSSSVPTGTILEFGGTVAPTGYLLLSTDATVNINVSRTTYAALFGVIGTANGAGDGVTTFTLPNKAGRTSVGQDTSGTLLSTANTGDATIKNLIGNKGGVGSVTLTSAQISSHTHTDAGHTHSVTDPGHLHTETSHTHSDSGHAHSNSLIDNNHVHNIRRDQAGSSGGAGGLVLHAQNTEPETSGQNTDGPNIPPMSISNASATASLSSETPTINSHTTGIAATNSGTASLGNTGGGGSHPNIPPYTVQNFIIKT